MKVRNIFPVFFVILFIGCTYPAAEFDPVSEVEISVKGRYIQLEPLETEPSTCFVFYPGGLVDPEAYVSLMQQVAEKGYRVIILKATADLAIFNTKRASKVMEEFSDIDHWIVGGHSLGGVVAIKAIVDAPQKFDGLVLFAAYPAKKDDLSEWSGAALSVSAENDGLTLASDIENGKEQLAEAIVVDNLDSFPLDVTSGKTIYYEIPGGIHGQFGDYGVQKGDGIASITRQEQHDEIVRILELFFVANAW